MIPVSERLRELELAFDHIYGVARNCAGKIEIEVERGSVSPQYEYEALASMINQYKPLFLRLRAAKGKSTQLTEQALTRLAQAHERISSADNLLERVRRELASEE
jgi:hypothetical protein